MIDKKEPSDDDGDRLLRASIPASMAIRLREHKIVTGRTIQSTVNEAIQHYLDDVTSPEETA